VVIRELAEKVRRKVDNGEMTINEARKKFGLSPIDGCDVLLTRARSDMNEAPADDGHLSKT